jgi:hypothetical protein
MVNSEFILVSVKKVDSEGLEENIKKPPIQVERRFEKVLSGEL